MHNYLKKIITDTQQTIADLKKSSVIQKNQRHSDKSFKQQLSQPGINVIAEIKRCSPSKGDLAPISDPIELATAYASNQVAAISVLTNAAFKGSLNDLQKVSNHLNSSPIAVLRKDFIMDEQQIFESIHYGADAILLIVAVTQEKTSDLLEICRQAGIDALVEVANQAELTYAVSIGAEIIGINNRDLNSFAVDTQKALQLKPHIPDSIIAVVESGIDSPETAKPYIDAGFNALLIGEALVKTPSVTTFMQALYDVKR